MGEKVLEDAIRYCVVCGKTIENYQVAIIGVCLGEMVYVCHQDCTPKLRKVNGDFIELGRTTIQN